MNKAQELTVMKLEDEYIEALTSNTLDKYPENYFTNKKLQILLNNKEIK